MPLAAPYGKSMVIEKILKVPPGDQTKVDDLKKRLQALQSQTHNEPKGPTVPKPPGGEQPKEAAKPAPQPTSAPAKKDPGSLSQAEQHELALAANPQLRVKEERTVNLVMNQVKELIVLMADANKRLKESESKHNELKKEVDSFKEKHEEVIQKMNTIDSRLEKFMGLYELVTNQYNPFADGKVKVPEQQPQDGQKAPPAKDTPKQAVHIEDSISKSAGTVELSPTDVAKSDEQFRRVEALLADLHKKAEEQQASPPVAIPADGDTTMAHDLHTLLAGFEARLTKQLDASVQGRLHEGLAKLEATLQQDLRDALRLEIEKAKAEDEALEAEIHELEALLKEGEPKDGEAAKKEFEELSSEIEALKGASRGQQS